ncbi:restriction endonuclease subunit S [Shewanella vesiculosa]|uniref:restriction endonuclease subunit S n=1 Tax=Shewanella vesiculosa TaxID=518738 RepID=UPI00384E5A7E
MVNKVKLGSLLSLLTDYHANGAYKKLKENVELFDEPDYAVMIRTTNFEQGCFDSNLKYISEHAYNFLAKSKVYTSDIIMNKIANAGSSYLMPDLNCPVSLAMNLFLLRIDENKANSTFVYLYLKLNEAYVKSFANGSVTKTITKEAVRNLEIELPNRSTQNYIVEVYMAYTNKLTLNKQTNQTLEQMAQTLFKSWFVDFDPVFDNLLAKVDFKLENLAFDFPEPLLKRAKIRLLALDDKAKVALTSSEQSQANIHTHFPSEFEHNEQLGWIPKGWKATIFDDLLESTIGGDWGEEHPDEKHTIQSCIVRGTDIPSLKSGGESKAPIRWVEEKKLKTRKIKFADIIIEVSGGSPTQPTGRSVFMSEGILNRLGGTVEPASFCRKFRPLNEKIGLLASVHLQKIYDDGKTWEYQNQSTGISNFQTKIFLAKEVVLIPSENILNKFYDIAIGFINRKDLEQTATLTKLRDALLPKLISGELQIPDVKATNEKTA